jgi:glycosyltransferase involved in cell wall biosynthesis
MNDRRSSGAEPRVSIAVPAYNCERYIAQSLDSLLGQTYSDFELVISDNASTDGTEAICRGYAARDRRVRYVRRDSNIGGPGNFRYVFALCRGAYHKWSTADDYWDHTFLEKAVAVLDARSDVVLCYSQTRLIDAEGRSLSEYEDNLELQDESPRARFNELYRRIGLCNAHLGLIRRGAMERTRLIGAEFNSDTHFLAELALYGKFSVIPEFLFFRRLHEHSSSWKRGDTEHQRGYYDPGRSGYFGMHHWRKYWHMPLRVWRAPISLAQKVGLSQDLLRFAYWDRTNLLLELRALVASRPT